MFSCTYIVALTTSQAKKALPDQPNVQPPHRGELGSEMVSSGEIQEKEMYLQGVTSHFNAKKTSEKEVLVCYGGNNNSKENFSDILTEKDKHQTGSSSFKDDDIADYNEAEVNVKIPKRRAGSYFTDYNDDKRGKTSG